MDASQATKTIKLLIVEDHLVTLEGLRHSLQSEPDLEIVAAAATASDGVQLAQRHKPDIVVLDLHLPDSDGPRSVIEMFSKTGSQLLIFSGENRTAVIHMALKMGVGGYLSKAETPAKLAEAARAIMRGDKPVVAREHLQSTTKLTKAEEHLLTMIARGIKPPDIAEKRCVSPATVRKQIELLILKLGLDNREALIAWAVQNGYQELGTDA